MSLKLILEKKKKRGLVQIQILFLNKFFVGLSEIFGVFFYERDYNMVFLKYYLKFRFKEEIKQRFDRITVVWWLEVVLELVLFLLFNCFVNLGKLLDLFEF